MAQLNDALQRLRDALKPAGDALQANLAVAVAGLAVVCLLLLVLALLQTRRARRLSRRLEGLAGTFDGGGAGHGFVADLDALTRLGGDVRQLADRTSALEANAAVHLQRVGLVRFNAFDDTGGNQSFALALLDQSGDGLVVSSLHARSANRLYAKALRAGRSDLALSDEETAAVEQARSAQSPSRGSSAGSPGALDQGGRGEGRLVEAARGAGRGDGTIDARSAGQARPQPPGAARADAGGRGLGPSSGAEEPMDATFLERRLRGQAAGDQPRTRPIWEDHSGS